MEILEEVKKLKNGGGIAHQDEEELKKCETVDEVEDLETRLTDRSTYRKIVSEYS